jgi:hypothetical protein
MHGPGEQIVDLVGVDLEAAVEVEEPGVAGRKRRPGPVVVVLDVGKRTGVGQAIAGLGYAGCRGGVIRGAGTQVA